MLVSNQNWIAVIRKRRIQNMISVVLLAIFMVMITTPIILAYLWMLVISLTGRGDIIDTVVLWRIVLVLVPTIIAVGLAVTFMSRGRIRKLAVFSLLLLAMIAILFLLQNNWNLSNFRFLIQRDIMSMVGRAQTEYSQIPSVWVAFRNSLFLASAQTCIVLIISTLSGYYLSRFAFRGREQFLQGLLILQAFPAMTLIIPLFVIIFKIGLLNTIWGPILVITTLELPFFIFIMKGFFDAVPWDIERSALIDGASRWQAFRLIVLPQVTGGMIAVGVFAFIKGWEEYVFVSALRTGDGLWLMSTYLFFVSEESMGVDYGLVAAVSVFYVMPSFLLYVFFQKYLTQMSVGGVKG